ncbi:MAG: hypothetical protein HY304_06300, partial [candidate division Zixibacteria bacterium]|nr:hypothetical protein [candidate division Zixibacteria bacterium]
TETVPESSEETADAELASLATLFPDSSAMDHPPEIDTDKIMINPALWQGEP